MIDLENFMPGCRNKDERRQEFRKQMYDYICAAMTEHESSSDTRTSADTMYTALCKLFTYWDYLFEEEIYE